MQSVLVNLEHVKHPKSILICPTLGIVVAFIASDTYQSIKPINLTLVLSWLSVLDQTIIIVIQSWTLLSGSISDHDIIKPS